MQLSSRHRRMEIVVTVRGSWGGGGGGGGGGLEGEGCFLCRMHDDAFSFTMSRALRGSVDCSK